MTNNTEILDREEEYRNGKEEYGMCKALEDMKRRWTNEGKELGIQQGVQKGIQQGIQQGEQKGIQQGIQVVVKTCQDLGAGFQETMNRLKENFSLSEEEARRNMEMYWK